MGNKGEEDEREKAQREDEAIALLGGAKFGPVKIKKAGREDWALGISLDELKNNILPDRTRLGQLVKNISSRIFGKNTSTDDSSLDLNDAMATISQAIFERTGLRDKYTLKTLDGPDGTPMVLVFAEGKHTKIFAHTEEMVALLDLLKQAGFKTVDAATLPQFGDTDPDRTPPAEVITPPAPKEVDLEADTRDDPRQHNARKRGDTPPIPMSR